MMPQDRRVNTRKTPKHLGYLSLPFNNGGFVLDVSEGGIGFQSLSPLRAQGPIQFRFAIDSPTRIRAAGEVAWIDETGKAGGLRFTQLPEGVREKIRTWVTEPNDSALDLSVVEKAPLAKAAPRSDAGVKPIALLTAGQPPIEAPAEPPNRVESVEKIEAARVEVKKNPAPHASKPIYVGPPSQFSMFAADKKSKPQTDSAVARLPHSVRHPMAALTLTIVFAFLVSVPLFAYWANGPAGDALFDWSQKFWSATDSQALPRDAAPPAISSPNLPSPPQQ